MKPKNGYPIQKAAKAAVMQKGMQIGLKTRNQSRYRVRLMVNHTAEHIDMFISSPLKFVGVYIYTGT